MDDIAGRVSAVENRLDTMDEKLTKVEQRLSTVESIGDDVAQILGAVNKIAKLFRVWAPTIVGAAISAGMVNGKLGEFLHAVFVGATLQ